MKLRHCEDLKSRTIKSFADILILKFLKVHALSSGYQILKHLHEEFDVLFSPGTIYHQIYLLERKNLIKGDGDDNSRIYSLTAEGEKKLASTVMASGQIQELVLNILS